MYMAFLSRADLLPQISKTYTDYAPTFTLYSGPLDEGAHIRYLQLLKVLKSCEDTAVDTPQPVVGQIPRIEVKYS